MDYFVLFIFKLISVFIGGGVVWKLMEYVERA